MEVTALMYPRQSLAGSWLQCCQRKHNTAANLTNRNHCPTWRWHSANTRESLPKFAEHSSGPGNVIEIVSMSPTETGDWRIGNRLWGVVILLKRLKIIYNCLGVAFHELKLLNSFAPVSIGSFNFLLISRSTNNILWLWIMFNSFVWLKVHMKGFSIVLYFENNIITIFYRIHYFLF